MQLLQLSCNVAEVSIFAFTLSQGHAGGNGLL